MRQSIPLSFVPIYNTWAPEHQKEMIDDCKQSLCRALFNKNAADGFWTLFESIYTIIVDQPTLSVQQIFNMLDNTIKDATPDFDTTGNLFFDSLFTKRDETYSGSEAAMFHLAKLYSIRKVADHSFPIIVDSFRAEDLSTPKEAIVLDLYKQLPNQIIFTTTLKAQEAGKYDG